MSVDLAYSTHGAPSSPVMVLLHGIDATASRTWDPVVPLLEDFYLVVPDLRGHGTSPAPGSYRLEELADDVVALLDRLGIRGATVVGHGLGGALALILAYGRPDLVARFVLEDTPAPIKAPDLPSLVPAPRAWDDEYEQRVGAVLRAELRRPSPSWEMRVAMIRQPGLAIGGGAASSTDQCALEYLVGLLPNGTWVTTDAGHHVHSARPAAFIATIRDWLATSTPPQRSAALAGISSDNLDH